MGRKRLETGTAGSVGTGDTIHNGGNKLRDNSDEFYHISADFELTDAGESYIPVQGDTAPRPFADGYYNRIPPSSTAGGIGGPNNTNLQNSIVTGGKYDLDSSTVGGGGNMIITLPRIGVAAGQAKRGEHVVFQNTTGSFSDNPLELRPEAGQAILGANTTTGSYVIRDNHVQIDCIVTDDGTGAAAEPQWTIKISPIGGEFGAPVNHTEYTIPSGDSRVVDLFDVNSYPAIKIMMFGENRDTGTSLPTRWTASEILLLNTGSDVYVDEYSVINSDSAFGSMYSIACDISTGRVRMTVTSNDDNVSVSIKSIETIRLV
ncbi:baseplate wedge tail fiber protein connector [Vibrio phage D479]